MDMITKIWRGMLRLRSAGLCKFCAFLFVPQMGRQRRKHEELKREITYLIGKERAEGNIEPLTAEYVSRVLNAPLEEVKKCMDSM